MGSGAGRGVHGRAGHDVYWLWPDLRAGAHLHWLGETLFSLLPTHLLRRLGECVDANMLHEQEWSLKQQRFRELTFGRLSEAADVFAEAAALLQATAEPQKSQKISYTIANIPDVACQGCAFYKSCWQEDFDATYEQMQKLYAVYLQKHTLREKDLGGLAKSACACRNCLLGPARFMRISKSTVTGNAAWRGVGRPLPCK